MIDIHCHLLPGADDGARFLDEALDMADIAVESGVSCVCVTPHTNQEGVYENYESEELLNSFSELQAAMEKEKIPLRIVRGAELYSNAKLPDYLKNGKVTTLNGSRYALVEFAFDEPGWYIEQTLSHILDLDKVPVIAHPERYYCVQDHPALLYEWVNMGALSQVNKGSIMGRFGPRSERTAEIILDHRLATCIASDAHRAYIRTTDMSGVAAYVEKHYSGEYLDILLHHNPEHILNNMELPESFRPIPFERKKFIW